MDRLTKIRITNKFYKEYAYAHDHRNFFIEYWLYSKLLDKVYSSRGKAYEAIDNFIESVKTEFKQDYSNTLIPNIRDEWFYLEDYKEVDEWYD